MTARPWTNHEERTFIQMAHGGFTSTQIASQLGRTIRSVQWRLEYKGIRLRGPRATPKKEKTVITPTVRIAITKEQVIAHYELGWRFVEFGFQVYFFEWGGKGEPKYPYSLVEVCPSTAAIEPEMVEA